jgi:hypothetical protein
MHQHLYRHIIPDSPAGPAAAAAAAPPPQVELTEADAAAIERLQGLALSVMHA